MICECVLQIYIFLSAACYYCVSHTVWQSIIDNMRAILEESEVLIGYFMCQKKAAELLIGLTLMSEHEAELCISVIDELLNHSTYEVVHIVLDIIFTVVCEGDYYVGNDDISFPLITKLSVVKKSEVKDAILNSNSTAILIAQYLIKSEYPDDLYKGLLVASSFPLVLNALSHEYDSIVKFLVRLCKEQEEKVVSTAICCIGTYLSVQVTSNIVYYFSMQTLANL